MMILLTKEIQSGEIKLMDIEKNLTMMTLSTQVTNDTEP